MTQTDLINKAWSNFPKLTPQQIEQLIASYAEQLLETFNDQFEKYPKIHKEGKRDEIDYLYEQVIIHEQNGITVVSDYDVLPHEVQDWDFIYNQIFNTKNPLLEFYK